MTTRIENARLVRGGVICEQPLYIADGRILAVGGSLPCDEIIDAGGMYAAPGFVDVHVHGGGGSEFIDGTEEAVLNAAAIHAAHGTTTLIPTLSSYETERTVRALKVIRACRGRAALCIPGVHLEGPYFSPKQSGAQDPAHIRVPRSEEYGPILDEYGPFIRRWSFAPELDGSLAFLDALTARGIVPAAGHTDAEFSHMRAAHEHGLRLITHLYSCTSTVIRRGGFRVPGVIESAWYFDDMDVEIIADGCHLPPEMIRMVWRIKGTDRTCLVTDAIRYGGMDNVDHISDPNGNVPYVIEDGVAKLADRTAFAGSIATMDRLVRTAVQKAGIPLPDAVRMASETPARVMHLDGKGRIDPGFDADLVFLDDDLIVRRVIHSQMQRRTQ